jgi:general secretion pathway protein K
LNSPTRQRGIALITAILVVSLAAIAATAVVTSGNVAIHRAGNLQDSERAWWYVDGAEAWVKSGLERDLEQNKTDSLADVWAKPIDYIPVDEGSLKGAVIDLQGRFNLNNLGTTNAPRLKDAQAIFTRLLLGVDPDMDEFRAKALMAAIKDWIDKDSEPTGMDGAEDTDYLGVTPAYRVPNRNMTSISELLAVKGMTKDLYLKLTQCAVVNNIPTGCIAALPQMDTTINVNTAPEPVLLALVKEPGPEIHQFVADRVEKPLEDKTALTGTQGFIKAGDVSPESLDVKSSFFMLKGEAFIGAGHVALYSFYYRPAEGRPSVYGRSTDTE